MNCFTEVSNIILNGYRDRVRNGTNGFVLIQENNVFGFSLNTLSEKDGRGDDIDESSTFLFINALECCSGFALKPISKDFLQESC